MDPLSLSSPILTVSSPKPATWSSPTRVLTLWDLSDVASDLQWLSRTASSRMLLSLNPNSTLPVMTSLRRHWPMPWSRWPLKSMTARPSWNGYCSIELKATWLTIDCLFWYEWRPLCATVSVCKTHCLTHWTEQRPKLLLMRLVVMNGVSRERKNQFADEVCPDSAPICYFLNYTTKFS